MAITVSKNHTVGSSANYSGFIYRLYTMFDTGGDFNSQWAVVDTQGTFTSESSPSPGDYFRVQCQTAWADTTQQEVLIGYSTGAAAVGGYAAGIGLAFVGAPKGDWNSGTETYDGVNTGIVYVNRNLSPCAFHAWADDEQFIILADNGAGNWISNGFAMYLGKLNAADTLAKPWALFVNMLGAVCDSPVSGFGSTSATTQFALDTTESACQYCYVLSTSHIDVPQAHSAADGKYRAFPLLQVVERVVANATVGDLAIAKRINKNIAGTAVKVIDSTNHVCIGGFCLPW